MLRPYPRRKIRVPDADNGPMRDEGDRFVAWRLDDALATPGTDLEEERMERALLAYAHRSAARVGAEWFAAEFARREEEDRLQEALAAERLAALNDPLPAPAPEITLIDASVEDAVVGGAPMSLGLAPVTPEPTPPDPRPATLRPVVPEPVAVAPVAVEPVAVEPAAPDPTVPTAAIRHPHVPRPPAPEPPAKSRRRRRDRKRVEASAPSFVISAPEWARMSPGARRLYGLDASPNAAGTG
jgi:hypothetical protein